MSAPGVPAQQQQRALSLEQPLPHAPAPAPAPALAPAPATLQLLLHPLPAVAPALLQQSPPDAKPSHQEIATWMGAAERVAGGRQTMVMVPPTNGPSTHLEQQALQHLLLCQLGDVDAPPGERRGALQAQGRMLVRQLQFNNCQCPWAFLAVSTLSCAAPHGPHLVNSSRSPAGVISATPASMYASC